MLIYIYSLCGKTNWILNLSLFEEYILGGRIMYCINCGKQIPDGSKFCTNCGASQVNNQTPAGNQQQYQQPQNFQQPPPFQQPQQQYYAPGMPPQMPQMPMMGGGKRKGKHYKIVNGDVSVIQTWLSRCHHLQDIKY